ncbi:hypothetical protein DL546_004643 [Coniochaeta pulveracea]|uniref:Uncharacterized protein n=1 Tax=Coniochaeta pulveracea TaxID=177199 RepID=A0A420YA19_9PEZI|nr:hypothetical protein DL546_004643 [Coniochaeta pulveracea]
MKVARSVILTALLVSLNSATPLEGGFLLGVADNCLRAIRGTSSIGLAYCSSALSVASITSTSYVAAPTVTIVVPTTATTSTTMTTITGIDIDSHGTTIAAAAQPNKRRTDPISRILSQCGNNLGRVSSACRDFLKGVPTSTTTITSTTTPTELRTVTTTATTTQTLITPPTPTNLWQNPSFEAPLPASSLFLAQCTTGCDVSLSPTSHTGLLGLRLLGLRLLVTSTGQKAGVVQTFTTTSPSRYLFSFWYRVDGPVVPDARLNYWIDYEQVQFFSGGELSTEWRLAGPFEVGGGGGVWERQCGGDHDGGEI